MNLLGVNQRDYRDVVLASKPQGYWRSVAGGTMRDELGGTNLSLSGAAGSTNPLLPGRRDHLCLSLSGGYASGSGFEGNPGSSSSRSWSIACWVVGATASKTGGSQCIFDLFSANSDYASLWWGAPGFYSGDAGVGGRKNAGGGSYKVSGLPAIPAGKLTHLIGVYDDSAAEFRMYVDGVFHADVSLDQNYQNTTQTLSIGVRSDGSFPFGGLIDEAAFWIRALDFHEISRLYKVGRYGEN